MSNALGLAILILAGALVSVYGVFRYLEATKANELDIKTALTEIQNVRCDLQWESPNQKGKGFLLFGAQQARAEYELATDRAKTHFTAIVDAETSDMHFWTTGENSIVKISGAFARSEFSQAWWNIGTISNCKPEWKYDFALFQVPQEATVNSR